MADRFLIGPQTGSQQSDLKPWALPENAYAQLTNMYSFRGRTRKRFGSLYMIPSDPYPVGFQQLGSRLAIDIDVIALGTLTATVPGGGIANTVNIGGMFSVGTNLYTIWQDGSMIVSNAATNGTIALATGIFTINDPQNGLPVIWYPALPVMGLPTYQSGPLNDLPTFGFDTRFAYQYTNIGWRRLGNSTTAPNPGIWTGSDSQFFWAENYQGTSTAETFLYVTNNNTADGMQYWDGSAWNIFNPAINNTGDNIVTCLMMIAFKSRLLLCNNTVNISASNATYENEIRWSMVGDASNTSPYAFYDTVSTSAGNWKGAGLLRNSQTQEAIVSAEFIKDRLIFSYEKSTYELAYTGNQYQPFVWNQLNTELGAESTFSPVPFDKFILTVGNVGVHSCNGSNVERIDDKIPDEVFDIQNENFGVQRVYGIRDYYSEMAYWTYPDATQTNPNAPTFPNRVFVFNYKTGAWAFNTDSITCFGYYDQLSDQTWATTNQKWEELDQQWDAGAMQGQFRQVIAGNQEGYTFIIDRDTARNVGGLQITNIVPGPGFLITLTIVNHNLSAFENLELSSEYLLLEDIIDTGGGNMQSLNDLIFQIVSTNSNNDTSTVVIDASPIGIPIVGTYGGGGTAARVSNYNVLTKEYNPYRSQGKNVYISKIEFLIDKTDPNPETGIGGAITVDAYPSSSDLSTLTTAENGVLYGTTPGVLETTPYDPLYYPLEQYQNELWHSLYFQVDGTGIQFRFYMSNDQMLDPDTSLQDFQLHAFVINATPIARLQ